MLWQSKLRENMRLTPVLFLIGLFMSSLAFSSQENSRGLFDGFGESGATRVDGSTEIDRRSVEKGFQNGEETEDPDSDFEDDYSDDLINSFGSNELNVQSVTHLHEEKGEVLVPCFGMWWPVGPTYDDGGNDNDGGDGEGKKKKKRRSRKQKKAARMKKKKS